LPRNLSSTFIPAPHAGHFAATIHASPPPAAGNLQNDVLREITP
jgi:hypothetical protein